MKDRPARLAIEQRIALEAANWLVRCDAGLNLADRDEFTRWLEIDSRHREEFARHQAIWSEFDLLVAGQPKSGAATHGGLRSRSYPRHRRLAVLAAAAALVLAIFVWRPWTRDLSRRHSATVEPEACARRVLEDGSIVELNRGAAIEVGFSAAERRVRLVRGEAIFTVAKNATRPFVVRAGGLSLRAVGTAFDVRLGAASVEVLVTEGRVRVNQPSALAESDIPTLAAGQRMVVSLAPADLPPRIVDVSADEITRVLAWRPRLLDFTAMSSGPR